MASLDQNPGDEDPDAYAARLAAMARAAQGGTDNGAFGANSDLDGPQHDPGTIAPFQNFIGPMNVGEHAISPTGTYQAPAGAPAGTPGAFTGTNPIDAANAANQSGAMSRAADAARPVNDVAPSPTGMGGAYNAPPTTTAPITPPVTPQQVAQNGSLGAAAQPSPATTGGSVGAALQPAVTTPTPAPTGAVSPLVDAGAPGQTPSATTAPSGAGSGTTGAGGSSDLAGLTGSIVQQIQGLGQSLTAPGTPNDVSATYLTQAQSILNMITQQEASLRSNFEKQGTTMDPATQFAIDKLKETLAANIQSTKEQLNTRGLYDSGIELQLENNLQKGNASDQAQLLGTRMSKLQDQLNTGLQQLGSQRITTASQFGLAGANAQHATDQQTRDLAQKREQEALQGMLGLRGQQSTENTAAAQRALIAAQDEAARAQNQAQFNSTQQFTGQQNAMQRAAAAALEQQRIGAGAYRQPSTGMTDYQRAELALRERELATKGSGLNATNTDAATNSLLSSANGSYEAAVQQAMNPDNIAHWQANGVDIKTVLANVKAALAGQGVFGNER